VLSLPPSVQIYLAAERIDMRKGFDGLVAIVQHAWKLDPYSGHLFVFVGRRNDRIKVLMFDRGGFALYYKRLEAGHFHFPAIEPGAARVTLEGPQLTMLLDGIDIGRVRKPTRWRPPRIGGEDGAGDRQDPETEI
jgi:transposase